MVSRMVSRKVGAQKAWKARTGEVEEVETLAVVEVAVSRPDGPADGGAQPKAEEQAEGCEDPVWRQELGSRLDAGDDGTGRVALCQTLVTVQQGEDGETGDSQSDNNHPGEGGRDKGDDGRAGRASLGAVHEEGVET
jgi:hypothetical protein